MTEKKANTTTKRATKTTASRTRITRRRKPTHAQISKRAYFIHLDEGHGDEVQNWLRAEQELTAA